MRSPQELALLFRSRGLKMTPQRHAVIGAIYANDRHLTAEAIWSHVRQQMPTVSQKTVYQVLNDLIELGEIRTVSVDNVALRFDPNVSEHSHFVCRSCGRVLDVQSSAPSLHAERDENHVVDSVEIIFRGNCSSCRAELGSLETNSQHSAEHNSLLTQTPR